VKTCSQFCLRVHHVQTADDLRKEWFYADDTVGITAGTSTPDAVIDAVEKWLHQFVSISNETSNTGAHYELHPPDEREIFACRQVVEQRQIFRHHTDVLLYRERAFRIADIFAEDVHVTAARREQTREHLDGCGFSRAVRAEKTVETTGLDPQIQFIDCAKLSEIPRQVGSLNGYIHGVAIGRKLSGAGCWSNRK